MNEDADLILFLPAHAICSSRRSLGGSYFGQAATQTSQDLVFSAALIKTSAMICAYTVSVFGKVVLL